MLAPILIALFVLGGLAARFSTSRPRLNLFFKFMASLALGGALLVWVMEPILASVADTPAQALEQLRGSAGELGVEALGVYALLFLVVHVARIARWVAQVKPLGENDTALIFRVCAVGYGAIVALPFRIGEIVRPYLLSRESKEVDFGAAMGTAVVERIIDGLIITGLLFLAVASAPIEASQTVRSAGAVSALVFVSAFFGLSLFAWKRAWALWLIEQTFGRISSKLEATLIGLLEGFVSGLVSLRSSGALGSFSLWTALYWGTNALGIWWLAQSFGLALPVWGGFGVLSVLVVGIMVPGPLGFLGQFQLFLMQGLALYLPADSAGGVSALAFALTMNVVQLVIQILFSLPFMMQLGLNPAGLVELQREASAASESGEAGASS